MVRLESPSSINTFKQCKRKYFYTYIKKLPTKESIHTITGKAVHASIEKFHNLDIVGMHSSSWQLDLQNKILELFINEWIKSIPQLKTLEGNNEIIQEAYNEGVGMIHAFAHHTIFEIKKEMNHHLSFEQAFQRIKPRTEVYLASEKHQVRGYIDAIHVNEKGEATIVDYKTSRKEDIRDEYRLQLAIYALLYKEQQGQLPKQAGLHFLRHGSRKFLDVDASMVEIAAYECQDIQKETISKDIQDYPKMIGPLCKWKMGQCDFYQHCFEQNILFDE